MSFIRFFLFTTRSFLQKLIYTDFLDYKQLTKVRGPEIIYLVFKKKLNMTNAKPPSYEISGNI